MTLKPMTVMVTLRDGESLKLGIRSGNYKADGTRSTADSHGWFKVDHFRLQRIDAAEIPSGIRQHHSPLGEEAETGTDGFRLYDLQGRLIASRTLPQGRIAAGASPSLFILRRPDGTSLKFTK